MSIYFCFCNICAALPSYLKVGLCSFWTNKCLLQTAVVQKKCVVGPVPDTWEDMIYAKLAAIPRRPIKVIDNLTLPLKPWSGCKEEATVMADN